MGADTSKVVGGGYDSESWSVGDASRTQTDYSGSRRRAPISTRSLSEGAGADDVFSEDKATHSKASLQRHRSTLVVVNRGQQPSGDLVNQDPLMKKLEELHFFYPLMHDVEKRSGLFGTHNRKALVEIQSKVKHLPALKIMRMYENRLRGHAESVSVKQGDLSCSIKEVDLKVNSMLKGYSERAKVTAKYVDRLNKLDDLKRSMSKCQESFNECVAIISLLNDMLPDNERLEEFSPWVDEEPDVASECVDDSSCSS